MAARSATESRNNNDFHRLCRGSAACTAVRDEGFEMPIGRPNPPLIPQICRYFLRGHCAFGEKCYFLHDDSDPRNNSQRNRNVPSQNNRRTNNRNQMVSNANTSQPSTSGQTNDLALLPHKKTSKAVSSVEVDTKEKTTTPKTPNEAEESTECKVESGNEGDDEDEEEGACSPPLKPSNRKKLQWVNAPEFVPKTSTSAKQKSYAAVVNPTSDNPAADFNANSQLKLCPYAVKDGYCKYPPGECTYLHGEVCDLCGCAALHPYNEELRKKHNQECIEQHEKDMELSFAIARSKEKTCGVCFEVIMEKAVGEQRFGILPNCNHCFCLSCIRKWRQARQFENNIIRACPECRVTSDFVCPSIYWVDTKEDKDKLILDYKNALSKKDCKYFKKGSGKCPFGNKCFYLHAFPDGRRCDVGPPPRQRRRRTAFDNDIEVLQQVILWDFLDGRDNRWQSLDDIEDWVDMFSDSDDSAAWTDYDIFDFDC